MKSLVTKRSIVIAGHKTSVSLEDAFWKGLKEIASERDITLSEMVAAIDSGRPAGNLSSAIRLFVLDHYRTMIGAAAGTQGSHVEIATPGPAVLPNKGWCLTGGDAKPLSWPAVQYRQKRCFSASRPCRPPSIRYVSG